MEQLAFLLDQYGYALLFAVGFLEYVGAPIASVPVLLVAGALSAMGGPPLPGIVLATCEYLLEAIEVLDPGEPGITPQPGFTDTHRNTLAS